MNPEIVSKRGRKKKIIIDNSNLVNKDSLGNTNDQNKKQDQDLSQFSSQRQITLGSLNIVVHTANTNNKKADLDRILETDNQSSILIQDQSQKDQFSDSKNSSNDTTNDPKNAKIQINLDPKKTTKFKKEQKDIGNIGIVSKTELLLRPIKNIRKILDTSDKRQGLHCFWCCHPFEGPNIPRPISYDKLSNSFKTHGIFCSWSCVAAYSIEQNSKLEYVYRFKQLYEKESNTSTELTIAPSRLFLKIFGGPLSIEEFRNRSNIPGYISACSTYNKFSYVDTFLYENYTE